MAETTNTKSTLALAIEQNKPKGYPFDVQGIFGLGHRPVHKVTVHAPRKAEDENALKDAHNRVESFSAGVSSLANDEDLLNDAKAMAIIQRAVKDSENRLDAFAGVDWMRTEMTGDQIGQMLNLVNEVRRKESGIQHDMTPEKVDAIIQLCVRAAGSDIPERVLSQYQREYLTSLVVLLALRVYQHDRTGVSVDRDEETGDYVVKYQDGATPEWEALPDGIIDDPSLDEGVEDSFPEDHEK